MLHRRLDRFPRLPLRALHASTSGASRPDPISVPLRLVEQDRLALPTGSDAAYKEIFKGWWPFYVSRHWNSEQLNLQWWLLDNCVISPQCPTTGEILFVMNRPQVSGAVSLDVSINLLIVFVADALPMACRRAICVIRTLTMRSIFHNTFATQFVISEVSFGLSFIFTHCGDAQQWSQALTKVWSKQLSPWETLIWPFLPASLFFALTRCIFL